MKRFLLFTASLILFIIACLMPGGFVYASEADNILLMTPGDTARPSDTSGELSIASDSKREAVDDSAAPVPELTTEYICFLQTASGSKMKESSFSRSRCKDDNPATQSESYQPSTPATSLPPLWSSPLPAKKNGSADRPKPITTIRMSVPASSAPFPKSYKKVGNTLVCSKKNDHPSKSDTNKKRHMDMECCLDPDEVPNPHCTYSSAKYAKFLNNR